LSDFVSIGELLSVSDLAVFALFLLFGSVEVFLVAFRDDCLVSFVPPLPCACGVVVASTVANATFLGRPRFLAGSVDILCNNRPKREE